MFRKRHFFREPVSYSIFVWDPCCFLFHYFGFSGHHKVRGYALFAAAQHLHTLATCTKISCRSWRLGFVWKRQRRHGLLFWNSTMSHILFESKTHESVTKIDVRKATLGIWLLRSQTPSILQRPRAWWQGSSSQPCSRRCWFVEFMYDPIERSYLAITIDMNNAFEASWNQGHGSPMWPCGCGDVDVMTVRYKQHSDFDPCQTIWYLVPAGIWASKRANTNYKYLDERRQGFSS